MRIVRRSMKGSCDSVYSTEDIEVVSQFGMLGGILIYYIVYYAYSKYNTYLDRWCLSQFREGPPTRASLLVKKPMLPSGDLVERVAQSKRARAGVLATTTIE